MCGISLCISEKPNVLQMRIIGEMSAHMKHRGTNATGMFTKTDMNKAAVAPDVYIRNPDFDFMAMEYVQEDNNFAVIHNRSGIGSPVKDAHPFKHGHITGVHNGWFFNLFPHMEKIETNVDSDAFFHLMSKYNKNVFDIAKGAYCVAWHDSIDDTLHLMKNYQIGFYLQKVEDDEGKSTIYGCSEERILKRILTEYDVSYKEEDGFEITSGVEYIFQDGKLKEIV